jgi:hypothetical protein
MSPVDNVSVVLEVELRLCSQLAAEVLGAVSWRSSEGTRDVNHVWDDRFDAIAFALYLGEETRHLVPVESILDVSIDV